MVKYSVNTGYFVFFTLRKQVCSSATRLGPSVLLVAGLVQTPRSPILCPVLGTIVTTRAMQCGKLEFSLYHCT